MLSKWQRLRSAGYLFALGTVRRMTLGARAALIEDRRVFLIRHTYVPGWQFPGGAVEPSETAEQGAAREVEEETGYRAIGPMAFFGLYHNANLSDRDHVAFFLCRTFEPTRAFKPNLEIAEAGWFDLDALPDGLSPATERRLAEIFNEAPRSAVW